MRSRTVTIPAPVRGWVENENLAANGGMGMSVAENVFPQTSTVRVRAGHYPRNNIGSAVKAMIPWRTSGSDEMFATSASNLFDVTTAAVAASASEAIWPDGDEPWPDGSELWLGFDPSEIEEEPPVVTGYGGRVSYLQIDTGAVTPFLLVANGASSWIYYDGSDWNPINTASVNKLAYDGQTSAFVAGQTLTGATSGATATILLVQRATSTTGVLRLGAITGGPFTDNEAISSTAGAATANGASAASSAVTVTGVATADLYPIWVHESRVWGVEQDTMKAWYLPVDAIGGGANDLNLGGVFQQGGALYFGATWSSDSGSGLGDRCVFVSTEGEVAVYEGNDPSSAETWGLVGVYNIARPVSTQTIKAGGDLLILTEDGIVPLSAVMAKDPVAVATAAVTYPIEPAWQRVQAKNVTGEPVQIMKWPAKGMMVVGYPHLPAETHVVNARTGAWAKWTGHDVQCLALHNGAALFGDSEGYVSLFEASGSDRGEAYVVRMSLLPDHLGAPGAYKTVHKARAIFRALAPFTPKLSVATDYRREFPTAPNAAPSSYSPALWDAGVWDVSRWDDAPDSEARETRKTKWKSIGRSGDSVSGQVQISCSSARLPDAEMVALDLLYEVGSPVG